MATAQLDTLDILARGYRWWAGEIAGLVPAGFKSAGGGRTPDMAIEIGEDGYLRPIVSLKAGSSAQSRGEQEAGADADDRALSDIARRAAKRAPVVRLLLPYSACLVRTLDVPRAAKADAHRIAMLDLERTTPLKAVDVYSATLLTPTEPGRAMLKAVHLVVKKPKIDRAVHNVIAAGGIVDRVDCWDIAGKAPLAVNFLDDGSGSKSTGKGRGTGLLVATILGLGLGAVVITTARHETTLLELQQQTSEVRERVNTARATAADAGKSAAHSSAFADFVAARPSAVEILEEITKRLPDTAWLTEFRLSGENLDIAGYATPAAELAPALEKSPLVASAALTAPIVFEEAQNKERFSLRVRLKTSPPPSPGPQSEPDSSTEPSP